MGDFLGRDAATVSRWETGRYPPEEWAAAVLYRLWIGLYGVYQGPYTDLESTSATRSDDALRNLGSLLLTAGLGYFIVKGLDALDSPDDDE